MATLNAVGVSMGLAPGENGPTAVRAILDFTAQLSQRYDGLAGDGSARGKYGYQTIFVDNGKNADALQVVCDGTLLEFTVPAASQAFLPIACPPGMLGLTFTVPNLGAIIPVMLFDTPTPYLVWPIGGGSTSTAQTKFGQGGGLVASQVSVGTAPVNLVSRNLQVSTICNRGTQSIFLGPSGVTTATGFELAPNERFSINGVRSSADLWGVSTAATRVDRIVW